MLAFRTQIQSMMEPTDLGLLREIGTHARAVVVRVPGLLMFDRIAGAYGADDPAMIGWENAVGPRVKVLLRSRLPVAFIVLLPPVPNPRVWGDRLMRRWKDYLDLSEALAVRLREIKGGTAAHVVVHAEDYAARWALDSGHRPDAWLLESPLVAYDELERWPHAVGRPALLRRTRLSRPWGGLALHFPQDEWICSTLPSPGRKAPPHGEWSASDFHTHRLRFERFGTLVAGMRGQHEGHRLHQSQHGGASR